MLKKIVIRANCPFCIDGVNPGDPPTTCDYCHGLGEYGTFKLTYMCETCEGTGQVGGEDCEVCSGKGYIPVDFKMLEDMVDKVNDIMNKCNDIFEKVNVP